MKLNHYSFAQLDPLIQPALLRSELPLSFASKAIISQARFDCADILAGNSDKIVVIVGPCSIHNPQEAREYAQLLKAEMEVLGEGELVVIMRAYFEKVSWEYQCKDMVLLLHYVCGSLIIF